MKNVSSLKSNVTNSPKTPGGISKSLLTPCRRVGLSRNWKRSGPSPFVSPVAGSVDVNAPKEAKVETRKRKENVLDENLDKTSESLCSNSLDKNEENEHTAGYDRTPSRNVEVPRRKKSKTLLPALNKSQVNVDHIDINSAATSEIGQNILIEDIPKQEDSQNTENTKVVSTPVRTKSKKNKKHSPVIKTSSREDKIKKQNSVVLDEVNINISDIKESAETEYVIKEKSPNDLSRECIVVIQRKIFKNTDKTAEGLVPKEIKNKKWKSSQGLFCSDSESDELPLCQINDKKSLKLNTGTTTCDGTTSEISNQNEDNDFTEKSTKIVKETKSPKNKLKNNKNAKPKIEKIKAQPKPLQSSYDDEDDDFDNKKTILIRKTYEKVSKPLKAKSTGSITQRDIDDLKARIEAKKKLLLAKSMGPDTEELRTLIKKWQKGCQDALMELLDLMKTKFHDKQDMGYSEMLKTLKIPPSLVGYDSDNDCFNTPDDATIILGQFNDV